MNIMIIARWDFLAIRDKDLIEMTPLSVSLYFNLQFYLIFSHAVLINYETLIIYYSYLPPILLYF